jgi:hypothetical protein
MGYAFSRDGAMPFSHVWCRVNRQEVPVNCVWLSAAVAYVPPTSSHVVHLFQFRCAGHGFLFVLWQSLGSEVAFQADAVDRDHWALRRLRASDILPRDDGEEIVRSRAVPPREIRAHRCLGGWPSSPSCVSLPVAYPVAKDNFNYTPVAVGGVLFLCVGAWVLNAPFWFR